jgi:O-antigen ligase
MRRVDPRWLAYALLAVLPFERIPSVQLAEISARPSMVLGLALIGVVAAQSPKSFWPDSRLKQALYGFLGVVLLSAVFSSQPQRALTVTAFMVYVAALAVSIGAAKVEAKRVWLWLLGGTVITCVFGLFQFFGDLAGLPNTVTGLKAAYSSQVFGFPRVQAAALEPLYLANFLLLPLGLGLSLGLAGQLRVRWLAMIYLVFFLTLSRGGVASALVLTIAMIGLGWFYGRRKEAGAILGALVAALLVAYGLLFFAVPALTDWRGSRAQPVEVYTQHLTNYEIGNTEVDRAKTRRLAWELFKSRPILGAGIGTFGFFANSRDQRFPTSQIANNEPLELLAETGLVGFGAALMFGTLLCAEAVARIRRLKVGTDWAWGVGLVGFGAATTIQYWSFSTLYITHIWVGIGLLMGFVAKYHKIKA